MLVPKKILAALTFAAAFSVTAMPFAAAQETEAVAPPAEAPARLNLMDAIKEAEKTLGERLAAAKKAGTFTERVGSLPARAEVTFAAWNREAGALRYLTARKSGTKLELLAGEAPLPRVTVNNREKSQYAFSGDREVVVGLIYPVAVKSGKAYDVTLTYRVPVTKAMYAPEVLAAGSDYLTLRIQDAFDDLRARGVKSVALPDRLLADVVDPYLVKSIVVIEHSSHVDLLSDFEPEREMGDFLVQLGLKGDHAFDGSVSSAGATGLAQFIPSTYKSLVKHRPELGLIPDFKKGMADHLNSLKAEIAYLDECLADMPKDIRASYRVNPEATAAVLAASYNGGSTRVRKALLNWGDAWDKVHRNENGYMYASSLRTETSFYVAKLRQAYRMFTSGYFATPTAPTNALPAVAEAPSLAPATVAGTPAPAGFVGIICFDEGPCSS